MRPEGSCGLMTKQLGALVGPLKLRPLCRALHIREVNKPSSLAESVMQGRQYEKIVFFFLLLLCGGGAGGAHGISLNLFLPQMNHTLERKDFLKKGACSTGKYEL